MKTDYGCYYRRWHDDSPAHLARMVRYFGGRIEPHLPSDRDAAILDVGCGMGFALETLRSLGYQRPEGVELDEQQAANARARGFTVTQTENVAGWLDARPAQFDVILLLDVLEHVAKAEQIGLLTAIHAALKAGGRLICSVPNASSTVGTRQRYIDWTHHTMFTEHSLDFVLHHGGFAEIKILADDGPAKPYRWLPLWRRRWWYVRGFFRMIRRVQLMAEVGVDEGRRSPLSPNLLGVAVK